MTYAQQTWADAPAVTTPISAARLAHMETGIDGADQAAADAAADIVTIEADIAAIEASIGLKVVQITQAAYDALSPPAAGTMYAVIG